MPRESKKGACSSHTVKAKANCLQHARRDYQEGHLPSYINPHLTSQNRTIYEDEMIKNRKSLYPLIKRGEVDYTEKTGQKCQASFAPFREAVLVVKADVTDEQLMKFKTDSEKETGWKCMGLWLHLDEGHAHSKYIEGDTNFQQNVHVHCLYDCIDHMTGKAIRSGRDKLSHMQDILANATGMERGYHAWETGRKHRKSAEERTLRQEERIEKLNELAATKQVEVESMSKAMNVGEEDMHVATLDEFKFHIGERKNLTVDDLLSDTQEAIDNVLSKPIPTFGQKEWREECMKEIRKILREFQKMLKTIGNLQKENIAKVKQNMYKDAKQKAADAILTKQENDRLETENRSLDKKAVARERAKTKDAILQCNAQKERADKAERQLDSMSHLANENVELKQRLENIKLSILKTYSLKEQNAIKAIIERAYASRFTIEQKLCIDSVMSQASTTAGKISLGHNLVNISRMLMEENHKWVSIPEEIEQIAKGTWQPVNIELRNAAVKAIVDRTECPSAKHFTRPQYNAIMAYIQDSGKSTAEAIDELWNIAKDQIHVIDAWKEHTQSDLNKIKNGEHISISGGLSY